MTEDGRRMSGSVTVFLSLCMVLILALVFTAIESARVSAGKASIESLFSNYDRQLLEKYKVLLLEDTGDFTQTLKDYMSYYENPYKNLSLEGGNLLPFQVQSIEITDSVYVMDQGGLPLEAEGRRSDETFENRAL